MLRRLLIVLAVLFAGLLVLPPLWYTIVGTPEPPELPAVGRLVPILEGQRINVVEEGTGVPIVLVHGLPGMAYDWRNLTHALARKGTHVYAYDRAGYGHSDPRPEGTAHTPPRNADELLALLDALGLDRVAVVGWSYGGVTAMLAAQAQPERFARMVLVGSGGPDSADAQPPEPAALMRFLYSDPVLAWRSRVPAIGRGLMVAATSAAYSGKESPEWWLPSLQANFSRWHTLETYRGEMFTIGGELTPASITVPTLVIHGDDDRLAPVAIGDYLAGTIPGAQLNRVEGGSHMLPVTKAGQLAEAIAGFVK